MWRFIFIFTVFIRTKSFFFTSQSFIKISIVSHIYWQIFFVFSVFGKKFYNSKVYLVILYIHTIYIHNSYCFIYVRSRSLNLRLSTNCVAASVKTKIQFSCLFSSRPVKRTYLFRNYCKLQYCSTFKFSSRHEQYFMLVYTTCLLQQTRGREYCATKFFNMHWWWMIMMNFIWAIILKVLVILVFFYRNKFVCSNF